MSRGRHPKAPVADALSEALEDGFDVEEIHRGHRWGVVACPTCGAKVAVWSTPPRVPEDLGRTIRRFIRKHRHQEGT